eukprot:TRINITY_DN776_c0_g1_i1.p1 TRINITY_DN776_c0_g1~~TRINITY_DN776_c0_g1_i1.p1  ORF type:complete len:319 (-),score=62.08 TRINITY_DN776_c0_g1_i1:155-1111(-)
MISPSSLIHTPIPLFGDASKVLLLIGIFFVARFLYTILEGIFVHFLRPAKNLRSYGEWAIVTGASDGIGEAYAHELARKRLNVILIARSQDKLKKVQTEIERDHKVQARIIVVDFSNPDPSIYKNLIEPHIKSLNIGILVNNVGISYEHPMYLDELPQDRIEALIQLNVRATTQMTKLVLPLFQNQRKGAIINVSSVAGVAPSPLLAVYSGTKAYIEFFSRALAAEYKSQGIFVQALSPSLVVSKLSKVRKPSLFIPSASKFVRSAVRTIGYDTETSGYWAHSLQTWFLTALPSGTVTKYIYNMHRSLRGKALAKKSS